ncbi:YxcD family protein [Fictibacillus sp. KIGAM418]|uniref:YxcD family protein n=1 Tax=Fictibacillus marinisediminis TaxID=2878389 RepID=A0A9X2BB25_9BACL|nr:YxcD family protein [Fictibacillus marinisediminis]MCK6255534.1 YxcD family protein [Fictibacillus marinisediminis]
MEQIMLYEQDIINALCLFHAHKKEVEAEDVQVELLYDDDYGFSAEVHVAGRKQVLIEANLIEAIRFYLDNHMNINSISAGLELVLDDEEGIVAYVRTR